MVDLSKLSGDGDALELGKAALTTWATTAAANVGVNITAITSVQAAVVAGAAGLATAVPFLALAVAGIKAMVKRLKGLWAARAECEIHMAEKIALAVVNDGKYPIVPRLVAKTMDFPSCYIKVAGYVYEAAEGRMSWRVRYHVQLSADGPIRPRHHGRTREWTRTRELG